MDKPDLKLMFAIVCAERARAARTPETSITTWWEASGYGVTGRWAVLQFEDTSGVTDTYSIEEYEYDYYSTLVNAYVASLDE